MNGETICEYQCECLCTFYMPDGIEPSFCPHCGIAIGAVEYVESEDEE